MKTSIIKYTTFFQHNPKYLILVFIRQVLAIITYTWISFIVIVVRRIRCCHLLARGVLKGRLLTCDNKVDVCVCQRLQSIFFVFRKFVLLLIYVELNFPFWFRFCKLNQGAHQQSTQMIRLIILFLVFYLLFKIIARQINLVYIYNPLHFLLCLFKNLKLMHQIMQFILNLFSSKL